ncbi:hypothetical protein ACIHAA_23940 [Streptomyces sp. NPDC052040]|uniref:hypothetical protein n=1 Tax=unclassified Streptomyces TaxID=2593676 RepID=UPI0037D75F22
MPTPTRPVRPDTAGAAVEDGGAVLTAVHGALPAASLAPDAPERAAAADRPAVFDAHDHGGTR